jgi:hypothetical protein
MGPDQLTNCRIAIALSLLALGACASVDTDGLRRPLQLRIEAGRTAEDCIPLDANDRVSWRFESTAQVDFNVHYHRGRELVTPVDHRRTQSGSGILVAPERESYCLMWKNDGAVPAFITGELLKRAR